MSRERSKVGRSAARSQATKSVVDRYFSQGMAEAKNWRWIVDNTMRAYGEVDPNECIVRINLARHKRYNETLIDTLVHEELHIRFPRLGEAMICRMTDHWLALMSKSDKARLYRKVRPRGRRRSR